MIGRISIRDFRKCETGRMPQFSFRLRYPYYPPQMRANSFLKSYYNYCLKRAKIERKTAKSRLKMLQILKEHCAISYTYNYVTNYERTLSSAICLMSLLKSAVFVKADLFCSYHYFIIKWHVWKSGRASLHAMSNLACLTSRFWSISC